MLSQQQQHCIVYKRIMCGLTLSLEKMMSMSASVLHDGLHVHIQQNNYVTPLHCPTMTLWLYIPPTAGLLAPSLVSTQHTIYNGSPGYSITALRLIGNYYYERHNLPTSKSTKLPHQTLAHRRHTHRFTGGNPTTTVQRPAA